MIATTNVSLRYGAKKLFEDVNVKFTPGNCYGLIGANGAGKSTFLKILSGEIEPNTGEVVMGKNLRLSVLKQNHFAFDNEPVLKTVMLGNQRLSVIIAEKDALYGKPDFSEKDGERASELEAEFAELGGWDAESEAGSMLEGLGVMTALHGRLLKDLEPGDKVKVLLAQALFGRPDVLLLDEPTNNLDIYGIKWLEKFLLDFRNTVIVVSHDRYFLNRVCSHIADIDYGKIKVYTGNYDFWRQSSELTQRLLADQNRKASEKAEELKAFIRRFSANASKSAQASSRQKQLEKLEFADMPASSRKEPYVGFAPKREIGNDVLVVDRLNKTIDGVPVLKDVSFTLKKTDKVVLLGRNELAKTALLEILAGEMEPDPVVGSASALGGAGPLKWGVTVSRSYFPADNGRHFKKSEAVRTLVDWLRQFSEDKDESFIRGFLGKMLFSRDEALKAPDVLSGGEKVRCMLAKMMLAGPNVLILDGPTAHLDLESISAVNEGIVRFKGVVIFTTHDHEFIQTSANRIIELGPSPGKAGEAGACTVTDDQDMTYEEFIAMKERRQI
jgi:ATPase subunit of ABC transporter with duplicated ATPase domains